MARSKQHAHYASGARLESRTTYKSVHSERPGSREPRGARAVRQQRQTSWYQQTQALYDGLGRAPDALALSQAEELWWRHGDPDHAGDPTGDGAPHR
jgi:hypothetical protein